VWQRIIVEPEDVAERVLGVVGRDAPETTVPRWYRAGSLAQALAPGLLVRFSGRR
jgi:hypothetical protein